MKMITNIKSIRESIAETNLDGRFVMMTNSKEISTSEEMVTEVILDNYEQRTNLEKLLKKNKFKMSDGIFGEQRDFSVGSSNVRGNGWEILITIHTKNVSRHNAIRKLVENWAHEHNTKRMKKNAKRK